MSAISLLQEDANWRSRKVQYSAGDWDAIQTVLPEFDLVPFNAGQDEPANPFLRTVMRRPLTAAERPIPVAVVSRNYSLETCVQFQILPTLYRGRYHHNHRQASSQSVGFRGDTS
jgi:hypothetical protein